MNALETPLRRLRDDPALLVETLVFLNLLSVVDLLLTITALRLGATELNPLMARLFEAGTAPTALVKTALVLVATLGLWALRRYRAALTATVALLIVYGLLATFELTGLLLLSL